MKGFKELILEVILFSSWISVYRCEMPEMTLAEKAEIFAQLSKIPLSKNPFFIKSIANSGQYDGEGTEGLTPDITGHSCRWIGNLECKSFNFQCDGQGVVDCTGSCPGDEDAVGKMISMMEDKELIQSFPLLAQMKAESEKDPEKAKRGKERFVQVLKNCNYGGLVALVGLSDGIDFGGQSNNDSLTFVDDDALSGFAYDYEDETTSGPNKTEEAEVNKDEPKEMDSMPGKGSISKEKDEMADVSQNGNATSDEMIKNMPVKESAKGVSRTLKLEMVQKNNQETVIDLVKSEVRVLRSVLLTAIDEADGIRTNSHRTKRSAEHRILLDGLVKDLKMQTHSMRRRIRSVAENMTSSNVTIETEKCKVQNISCAIFPTTAQCTGIALGGCMSHRKFLASLFTPRVIMFVIGGILVIVAAAVGIGFFVSKRKTMQVVEPVEQQETANTQKP